MTGNDLGMAEDSENSGSGSKHLREISFFAYFSNDELERLYQIGEIFSLKAGTHVVVEGEPTRGLYITLSGTVSVLKADKAGTGMHRLAHLEEGSAFGELSLFDDAPRSATVVAETNCRLFSLSDGEFTGFLESEGDELQKRFYKRCAEEMASRFRAQNRDYMDAQFLLWKHALRLPAGANAD